MSIDSLKYIYKKKKKEKNTYAIRFVYSYLKNRKQCVKINDTYSDLPDIISGVPQGSVGPILFNIFFNEFFYVILTSFGKTLEDLIKKTIKNTTVG